MKKTLELLSNFLVSISNSLLFIAMIGMTLVLGANIFLRFVFNQPISWANELSRFLYIYIVLLGTAVAYKEDGHAKIIFVRDAVSYTYKVIFDVIHFAAIIFLSVLLVILGIKHVITMWRVHGAVLTFLSMGIVYISVPFSFFCLFIFAISKFIKEKNRAEETS